MQKRFCMWLLFCTLSLGPSYAQDTSHHIQAVAFSLGENCYSRISLKKPAELCFDRTSFDANFSLDDEKLIWAEPDTERPYDSKLDCLAHNARETRESEKKHSMRYSARRADLFIACGVKRFYADGSVVELIKKPADNAQWGEYLSEHIIFPTIIANKDIIRFAVRDVPLFKGAGWYFGTHQAEATTAVDEDYYKPYEVTFDSSVDRPTLSLAKGEDHIDVPVGPMRVLDSGDQLVPGSCVPPKLVRLGDVLCVGSYKPFPGAEKAFLDSANGSWLVHLLARTSYEEYLRIPNLSPGPYSVQPGEVRDPFTVVTEIGGQLHKCDCVVSNTSDATQRQNTLSPDEIKRLKEIVEDAISGSERALALLRADTERRGYSDRESLVSDVMEVANVALEKLSGEPILGGIGDYIKERFSSSLTFLHKPVSQGVRISTIVPASFVEPKIEKIFIKREEARTVFNKIGRILSNLRTQEINPVLALEIRTTPTGATFVMSPKSYEEMKYSTTTNGKLINVWIGIYKYKISRPNFATIEEDDLNLVDDRRSIFTCALVDHDSQTVGCRRE